MSLEQATIFMTHEISATPQENDDSLDLSIRSLRTIKKSRSKSWHSIDDARLEVRCRHDYACIDIEPAVLSQKAQAMLGPNWEIE